LNAVVAKSRTTQRLFFTGKQTIDDVGIGRLTHSGAAHQAFTFTYRAQQMIKGKHFFEQRSQDTKVIPRVLLGIVTVLLGSGAQAGVETQKLVKALVFAELGTFVTVEAAEASSQECGTYSLIAVTKDGNYSARISTLLATKLASTPVTITYTNTNGSCTLTSLQVGG
jgi:hypothetical protein